MSDVLCFRCHAPMSPRGECACKVRYASVCDGIGAVHAAWQPLGWECAWVSEIEPFCNALVEQRWGFRNLGDMTQITEAMLDECDPIDILVGGTPCQSFSVAGLRKGLADPRGNLALGFLRIVDATRPRWVLWENVPGVLSSLSHDAPNPCPPQPPVDLGCDGAEVESEDEYDSEELHAFACFVAGLEELGYGWAIRALDAQYFGVAQRRHRVFVVGHLGDWRRAASVLFERDCLCGHPAPSREAGAGVAPPIAGVSNGGGANGPGRTVDDCESLVCSTGSVAGGLTARYGKGTDSDATDTLVTHSLRAEGFDASEDGTGRGTPIVPVAFDTTQVTSAQNRNNPRPGDPCHPLANGAHPPAVAYRISGNSGVMAQGDKTGALNCNTDPTQQIVAYQCQGTNVGPMGHFRAGNGNETGGVPFVIQENDHDDESGRGSDTGSGGGVFEGSNNRKDQACAADSSGAGEDSPEALCNSDNGGEGQHPLAFQTRIARNGRGQPDEVCPTLQGAGAGATSDMRPCVKSGMTVRRLTPRECERLQGFPDDYTLIQYRGKPAADGPRYRALGNSMAVPVMRWIGERIAANRLRKEVMF